MSKRIAKVGIFVALAMIFSYIEAIVPFNFGIPGVKLGIANIVVVTSLYQLSIKETVGISVIRIFLMGVLFGNGLSLIYSLAGGLLSLFGMIFFSKIKIFSVMGVSVIGGVLHNMGQLIAAAIILKSISLTYYLPVLLVAGVVTGLIIGLLSDRIIKVLCKTNKSIV